ncbi:hypothetical protein F4780DRAFT_793044 [Xylariomycetidae sp. FL0641]|nr:hypothetical protein F4780DRAFT_793044 [Xylariomycetidae sp. FL0641]
MGHFKEDSNNGDPAPPPYAAIDPANVAVPQSSAPTTAPTYTSGADGKGDSKGGAAPAHPGRKFPAALNAYYQKKPTLTFHLGESGARPLYAVRAHTGCSGKPQAVLHDGPSQAAADPPVLATARRASRWNNQLTVLMVPGDGGGGPETRVDMHAHSGWAKCRYAFSLPVGADGREETFEWRRSRGDEVRALDGYRRGWKLVRLGASSSSDDGGKEEEKEEEEEEGEEVVAAWAYNKSLSLTKAWKFRFLGAGVAGELGPRWEVVALISALRVWGIELETSSSAVVAANA